MLTTLCKYLNNYFVHDRSAFHFGEFEIEDGEFIGGLEFLQDGQYFRICGSVFNDGVYKYPATDLHDETFSGAIWAMSVPPEVEQLASDIADWITTGIKRRTQGTPMRITERAVEEIRPTCN